MTVFKSSTELNKPAAEIYTFLADLNNHQRLMPDNIEDWSSTRDEARFSIQNMAKLALKVEKRIENTEVLIVPFEKPPFDMELNWQIMPNGDTTVVSYTISADLNMMMKMFASGPLQKLADHETEQLTAIFS